MASSLLQDVKSAAVSAFREAAAGVSIAILCVIAAGFFTAAMWSWAESIHGVVSASLIVGAVYLAAAAVFYISTALRAAPSAPPQAQTQATPLLDSENGWFDPAVLSSAMEITRLLKSPNALPVAALVVVMFVANRAASGRAEGPKP